MAIRSSKVLQVAFLLVAAASPYMGAQEKKLDLMGPLPKGMMRIEGKKNPELIPQWLLWSSVFMSLGHPKPSAFWEPLEALTAEETEILLKESLAYRERQEQFWKNAKLEDARLKATGADLAAANKRLTEMELEFRWKTIEARDRVMAALSPDSQLVLANEVERYRPGISAIMAEADYEQWKRPQ